MTHPDAERYTVRTDRMGVTYGPLVDADGYVLTILTADGGRVEIEFPEKSMYDLWTEVRGTPWPEPDRPGEHDRLVHHVLQLANDAGEETLRECLRVLRGEQ